MEENTPKYKLITFASNKDGSKIFCRLAMNKKTLIKGFYDFNKDNFFITEYVKTRFPDSELTFFEDRDKSGYTFEQRSGYQAMRRQLMARQLAV